jgi:hypothetical protein
LTNTKESAIERGGAVLETPATSDHRMERTMPKASRYIVKIIACVSFGAGAPR